jgi:TPR repeat protein
MMTMKFRLVIGAALCLIHAGCATDHFFLASKMVEEERYDEAVPILEAGATEGDARCDYSLAMLMLSGELGSGYDTKSGIPRLRKAAEAELPQAQFELARLYETGEGVDPNLTTAAEWYARAADSRLPAAQARLGLLYASGRGVEKDLERAARLFDKAADGGDPLGRQAFGFAKFYGVGVPKNVVDGYVWTKLASRQGNAEARANLPAMVREMTGEQLKAGRYRVSKFEAKKKQARKVTPRGQSYDARDSARQRGNRRMGGAPVH